MERKKALVSGAGMGVGYGIARELIRAGYDVAIHYNASATGAQELAQEAEKFGGCALALQADLTEHSQLLSLFERVRAEFGRLDVFVNNSGITRGGPILKATEETFDQVCAVNWKGAYFCVQQAARLMVDTGSRGSIIIISSNQQETVWPGNSIYGGMKAALKKFTKNAAMEFAQYGIRVNSIAPGYVDTGAPRMGEKEPTYKDIPMRRWVSLEEMGQIALFLSGPYAGSITGVSMVVDGGAHLIHCEPERYGF